MLPGRIGGDSGGRGAGEQHPKARGAALKVNEPNAYNYFPSWFSDGILMNPEGISAVGAKAHNTEPAVADTVGSASQSPKERPELPSAEGKLPSTFHQQFFHMVTAATEHATQFGKL